MSQHLIVQIIKFRDGCTERGLAAQLRIVFDFRNALKLEYLTDQIEAVSLQIKVHLESLSAQYIVVGGYARVDAWLQLPQHWLQRVVIEENSSGLILAVCMCVRV